MTTPLSPAGQPGNPPVGPRRGRRRDLRGHGRRGPAVLPGPLTPGGARWSRSPRTRFDNLVLDVVGDLEDRWRSELGLVEFAVEETPWMPDDWSSDTVPLAALVRGTGTTPTRLVVFRKPIELRSETPSDLSAMVLTVLVEQLSELLGRPPEDIDPRYDPGDD